jgi:hypothetical protein
MVEFGFMIFKNRYSSRLFLLQPSCGPRQVHEASNSSRYYRPLPHTYFWYQTHSIWNILTADFAHLPCFNFTFNVKNTLPKLQVYNALCNDKLYGRTSMTSVHVVPQEMVNHKWYGMSHGMSLTGWAAKCGFWRPWKLVEAVINVHDKCMVETKPYTFEYLF